MSRTLISLFAKPPIPGTVKTRLARAVGDAAAAELARAFLRDTWSVLGDVEAERQISTSVTDPAAFGLGQVKLFDQGQGDLGARIEHTLVEGLRTHDAVLAVGADVPSMTASALRQAIRKLEHADAVLGPTLDGGFWCLGVRRMEPGWLAELPWSTSITANATMSRLQEHGMTVALLPTGWDVDEVEDLQRLRRWLEANPGEAAATRAVLEGVSRRGR